MPRSVATIDSPEFINVKPYNPLISQCEIKVLYVGENRNRSFISKEVATEMANSLPGCPIVGYYRDDKEDFADHGQRVTIDGDGVKFESLTKPYGFVAPDAKVWFQKFHDTDLEGVIHEREYLMTTGYLWTGQYEEVQRVLEKGNAQSMELDEKTLNGNWSMNNNSGVEFFIINDAIFSKLAILGEDVEPCFEGASVTTPVVSAKFTMDDEFKTTLFSMMRDLQNALELSKGGLNMTEENLVTSEEILEENTDFALEDQTETDFSAETVEITETVVEDTSADFNKDPDDQCKTEANPDAEDVPVDDENKDGEKFELEEESNFVSIDKTEYEALQEEITTLREYKMAVEEEKKDALIASFYMLSDEDKSEVVANKANYSLDEIEAKLSVICVRNKVNFDQEEDIVINNTEEAPAVTFNLEDEVDTAPAFVQVLRNVKKDI